MPSICTEFLLKEIFRWGFWSRTWRTASIPQPPVTRGNIFFSSNLSLWLMGGESFRCISLTHLRQFHRIAVALQSEFSRSEGIRRYMPCNGPGMTATWLFVVRIAPWGSLYMAILVVMGNFLLLTQWSAAGWSKWSDRWSNLAILGGYKGYDWAIWWMQAHFRDLIRTRT